MRFFDRTAGRVGRLGGAATNFGVEISVHCSGHINNTCLTSNAIFSINTYYRSCAYYSLTTAQFINKQLCGGYPSHDSNVLFYCDPFFILKAIFYFLSIKTNLGVPYILVTNFGDVTNRITNFRSPIFLFQVTKIRCIIQLIQTLQTCNCIIPELYSTFW